jgi:hypothetical protein
MASPITRAQIATQPVSSTTSVVMVAGFLSFGDSGTGAIYSTNGATSGGIMAIQDSLGVWWNLIGPTTGPVNAGIFGFLAGAAASAAPQTGMRNHSIANPGTSYIFLPGRYNITAGNFLFGVKDIELIAYGAQFYNSGSGTFGFGDVDSALMPGSGSLYHDMNIGGLVPATAFNGHLITDTVAGSGSVTCVTHSDASSTNYKVGDWCLVNWFVRQTGSFPPNPGYFEYVRVATAGNSGTGVIVLDRALKNPYKATSFEDTYLPGTYGTVTYGKARILNLDRANYKITERFVLRGCEGLLNGAGSAGSDGSLTLEGVIEAEVYDVKFLGILPSMCKSVKIYNSVFTVTSEIDKSTEYVLMEDCTVNNLIQSSGMSEFKMVRGTLTGNSYSQIRARKVSVDGTIVASQNPSAGGAQLNCGELARDSFSIKDCKLFPNSTQGFFVGLGGAVQCTPDVVTSTSMTFNAGNAQMDPGLRSATDIGTKITLQAGTTVQVFTVTDIAFDGSNNMILTGTYTTTPTAGDIATPLARNVQTVKSFIDYGGHVIANPPARYRIVDENVTFIPCQNGETTGPRNLMFEYKNGVAAARVIQGYVVSVTVNVIKAYTGTDATATIDVANVNGMGAVVNYGTVNVKTKGVRTCTTAGATGAVAGDTWATTIPNGAWCEQMYQNIQGTGGGYIFTDAAVDHLPLVQVTVQTT